MLTYYAYYGAQTVGVVFSNLITDLLYTDLKSNVLLYVCPADPWAYSGGVHQ